MADIHAKQTANRKTYAAMICISLLSRFALLLLINALYEIHKHGSVVKKELKRTMPESTQIQ